MLTDLNKIKGYLTLFKIEHEDKPDYPADQIIILKDILADAFYMINHFDWEEHSYDVREGAVSDAAEAREE